MEIIITSGTGHGTTPLSAFDDALMDAGTHNYNLIYISSIIPKGAKLKIERFRPKKKEYGYRLYCVKAEIRTREVGKYLGAALGWYQLPNGAGVFVEHEGIGETEEGVKANLTKEINESVTDLCKVRGYPLTKDSIKMKLTTVKSEKSSTSALVLAIYKSEGWGKK